MEHGLVIELLFFGMGKEQVSFPRKELFFRDFFYAQQDVAVLEVLSYFRSGGGIFLVGITAVGEDWAMTFTWSEFL